jgi:subtilisin family serine protease
VATSGGTTGPAAGTVAHLGPWVASDAATTHDRVDHANQLTGFGGPGGAPATIGGRSLTAGYGPAPIVYAGDFSNGTSNPEQCLAPFPPGTWTNGEIVLCDRGVLARVIKCQFAGEGGAAGCVLANVTGGATDLVAEAHYVPAIHIDATTGNALRSWLATGSGHTARITPSAINLDSGLGDVLGGFSARGPAPGLDLVKPDLAAPGVQILAAVATDWIPGFTGLELSYFDGTSMASPHVAGAAALLTALHPGWSPPEILSALATTSAGGVRKENGVTPAVAFDVGAGRIAPAVAARAGLVLDETAADFLAADPDTGGDPRSLNLAAMADDDCAAVCGWSRTVESALSSSMGWTATVVGPPGLEVTVTPAGFTLGPGATRTLAVDLSVAPGQPLGQWAFATLVLTPSNPAVPTARLPIAVRPTAANVGIFSDGFESGDTSAWSATVP